MKKLVRNQSLGILAGVLVLSACNSELTKQSMGKMQVAMQWQQVRGFATQAIPENTSQITINIRGAGLTQALERSLKREAGTTQRVDLILPTGSKEVRVQALGADGQVLAEAIDSVNIQSNQTAKLELDMKPVAVPEPIPTASSEPNSSSGGSGGASSDNKPSVPGTDTLSPPDGSKPLIPDDKPLLPPKLIEQIKDSIDGGGGGGSTEPLELSALPQIVSGLGYPSELILAIPPDKLAALSVSNFTWSCQDTGELNLPCDNFIQMSQLNRVIWTSPTTASGPYRISVDFLPPGRNTPIHREILVVVLSGTGTLGGSSQIGFDGAVGGL